ncbi:polysaccharide biosynthesis C-terminal domain-containing protein [Haloarcula marina]|uniref:oligosaccharide flippase family protein n=1 Tax=Haloarcula marina TaxID=2961574 RepID=UPI0020B63B5E|nr:oligosaccharide flippase family protein [Halomicroarcula marina]
MRLGKTTLLHFGSQVVVSGAGFAVTWVISYLLGEEVLGQYAVIVGIGFFWLAIPIRAVGNAVRKRISEGRDPEGYLGAGVVLNALVGVVLASAVLLGGELVARVSPNPSQTFFQILVQYNLELAALVVSTVAYSTVAAGLEGQKRVAWAGWLQAFERITRSTAQVALVVLSFGVSALVASHAAALAVAAVVGLLTSELRPSVPTREEIRELVSYARYAWMSTLRSNVFGWMDTIVLSFFVGAGLIGIYEAAWGIASLLGMVSLSIRRTLFPEVSDLSEQGDYDYIRHILEEGLLFSGVFVIPGLAGALVIGERVLQFYRPSFGIGQPILVVLVLAYAADVYASQFLNVINAVDEPRAAYRVNVAFIATNLTLNVLLVWQFGWIGAAIATATASALRAVLGYRTLTRLIGRPSLPLREVGIEVVAAALMTAVVVFARPIVPFRRSGTLMLVGIGAVVYVGALVGLSGRVREKVQSLTAAIA